MHRFVIATPKWNHFRYYKSVWFPLLYSLRLTRTKLWIFEHPEATLCYKLVTFWWRDVLLTVWTSRFLRFKVSNRMLSFKVQKYYFKLDFSELFVAVWKRIWKEGLNYCTCCSTILDVFVVVVHRTSCISMYETEIFYNGCLLEPITFWKQTWGFGSVSFQLVRSRLRRKNEFRLKAGMCITRKKERYDALPCSRNLDVTRLPTTLVLEPVI